MKKFLRIFIALFIVTFIMSYALSSVEVKYKEVIDTYAKEYKLDKELVYALIFTESRFKPSAKSDKGATGLMQLTDDTALWCAQKLGDENLAAEKSVPEINVKMGCFYLRYLLDRYDNAESTALAAYNAGAGNADKWLSDKNYSSDGKTIIATPFDETTDYIKKIDFYKKIYKFLYGNEE